MEHETAGDPVTGLKWTRKTTRKISRELRKLGIYASAGVVARLLKSLDFSLRTNRKSISTGSPKERDRQFHYIREQREAFEAERLPVISVDAKKKELIGNFKNAGVAWEQAPTHVRDHDFRSHAECLAVPYGILDLQANRGRIFVGLSHDTPAFAVDAIAHWWNHEGHRMYPDADHLLVLADGGGSNGARVRRWKFELQNRICNHFRIPVTVCHYPPGASKWNPVEHRLFGPISKNWEGRPLVSLETMLKYIRTTKTRTGLRVSASCTRRTYPKGLGVTDQQMTAIDLQRHSILPQWNYTILPTGS